MRALVERYSTRPRGANSRPMPPQAVRQVSLRAMMENEAGSCHDLASWLVTDMMAHAASPC